MELRVENLSFLHNLDLNGDVPAINDEWLEQSRLWGQGQEEDEEVSDLLSMDEDDYIPPPPPVQRSEGPGAFGIAFNQLEQALQTIHLNHEDLQHAEDEFNGRLHQ